MHVIQLFLEIVDLLFQRGFPVELFLVAFLRLLSFRGYFGDFHKLIDGLADQFIAAAY